MSKKKPTRIQVDEIVIQIARPLAIRLNEEAVARNMPARQLAQEIVEMWAADRGRPLQLDPSRHADRNPDPLEYE